MIKFFRNIRLSFLKKDKPIKYLTYAVGEIFLVVIGILIALGLNNINTAKNRRAEEINILTGLKEDFKADIADFKINLSEYSAISSSVDVILNRLETNAPYNDTLDTYFAQTVAWPFAIINKNAFDVLTSKELDLISNDTLRQEILTFHSQAYAIIKIAQEMSNRTIYFDEMIRRFDKVEPWKFDSPGEFARGKMKPNDYNALKKDMLYKSILSSMKRDADDLKNGRYFMIIEALEKTIQHIDLEIERLREL